jgi:hypothetical protein
VRISTPRGSGTGFLVARSSDVPMVGIATAAHVIADMKSLEEGTGGAGQAAAHA